MSDVRIGEFSIGWDATVLRPRPWTVAQGLWAAELLHDLPPGPVLELCCGAGHIGLVAVRDHHDRHLVAVDASPDAIAWTRTNAERHGIEVEARHGDLDAAAGASERFALIIADPPWVRHDDVASFPADPVAAIDGGDDGLDVARRCLDVAARHLMSGGVLLLQLGNEAQLARLVGHLEALDLCTTGRLVLDGYGTVAQIVRRGAAAAARTSPACG